VTWIWPGKTGEVVPKRSGLSVAAIDQYSSRVLASAAHLRRGEFGPG